MAPKLVKLPCFWKTPQCRLMAHLVISVVAKFGRFSNRPFWVKRFQTIHQCSVGVAHGLVLLFGIGTKALPSWESRTRRNDLLDGLAVRRTAGTSDQTNSPHPSSREGHLSTVGWNSSILLWDVILCGRHPAAIFRAALLSDERQVQATKRTHLIHRPARDIFPP